MRALRIPVAWYTGTPPRLVERVPALVRLAHHDRSHALKRPSTAAFRRIFRQGGRYSEQGQEQSLGAGFGPGRFCRTGTARMENSTDYAVGNGLFRRAIGGNIRAGFANILPGPGDSINSDIDDTTVSV